MTTPQKQADALRALANLIEFGNAPGNDYRPIPLHTWLAFRNDKERQQFIRKAKFSGFEIRATESEKHVSVTHGGPIQTAGLEITLTVPAEEKDS
ncbi:hypothetical protein [Arthrobacter sp. S41]|uniref:hypothetical protein n=1 Tax=Arthrobacter sp. S41 TaxID=2509721 RepID=UPI001035A32C|nr:hypothetical protein [Arthrobacter sp. S41]TAP26832.1 hypothetical protein EYR88_00230 [Arthrobacter sp. S41]